MEIQTTTTLLFHEFSEMQEHILQLQCQDIDCHVLLDMFVLEIL